MLLIVFILFSCAAFLVFQCRRVRKWKTRNYSHHSDNIGCINDRNFRRAVRLKIRNHFKISSSVQWWGSLLCALNGAPGTAALVLKRLSWSVIRTVVIIATTFGVNSDNFSPSSNIIAPHFNLNSTSLPLNNKNRSKNFLLSHFEL